MKYEELQKLNELREKGIITEEEYRIEKEKVLNSDQLNSFPNNSNSGYKRNNLGMSENSYLLLMHLSQFFTLIITLILWLRANDNETINKHGKNIMNFHISFIIYVLAGFVTSLIFIGMIFIAALCVIIPVFVIIAASKASRGEYWEYPLTVKFFK